MIAMTQAKLTELQRLLQKSDQRDTSAKADAIVLDAAAEQARQAQRQLQTARSRPSNSAAWIESFSSASLAVVLTLGSSLLLYYVMVGSEQHLPAAEGTNNSIAIIVSQDQPNGSLLSSKRPPKPHDFAGHDPQQAPTRPAIQYEFADLDDIIAAQNINNIEQQDFAAELIQQAIADISYYLQSGELDYARERYQNLQIACAPCKLPETLEVFAQLKRDQDPPG